MAICQAVWERTSDWLCSGITPRAGSVRTIGLYIKGSRSVWPTASAAKQAKNTVAKKYRWFSVIVAKMQRCQTRWIGPLASLSGSLSGYVPRTCRCGSLLYFRHVHACPNSWTLQTGKWDNSYPARSFKKTHSLNCYYGGHKCFSTILCVKLLTWLIAESEGKTYIRPAATGQALALSNLLLPWINRRKIFLIILEYLLPRILAYGAGHLQLQS